MFHQLEGQLPWLKVLLLEDLSEDAFLVEREVKKVVQELDLKVAKTGPLFEAMVPAFSPHLILSDYALPQYGGLDALNYVKGLEATIPFIFVTSTLQDEELAAATILNGANGFVLKNNLNKLGPLVLSLMTTPQTNTSFELQSSLWIYQYQTEIIERDGLYDSKLAKNILKDADLMYQDAQMMLKRVHEHMNSLRDKRR